LTVARALALFLFLLLPLPSPAAANEAKDGEQDQGEAAPAVRSSFWGEVPAPSDSVTHAFENRKRGAWEYVLLVPYQAIHIPFVVAFKTLQGTYMVLDESGVVQKTIDLFGPREVPWGFLASVRAGGLSGFGGGVTLYHDAFFGEHNRLKIRTKWTTTNNQKYTLGVLFNDTRPFQVQFGSGYRLRPNARFFGIGSRSRKEDESWYTQETAWAGLGFSQELVEHIRAQASGTYSSVGTRGPEDESPAIEEQFSVLPPGFGDRSHGVTFSLMMAFDNTLEDGRPESGTVLQAKASSYTSTADNDVAFWTFRGNAEQFIPLWHTERALAVRAYASWIENNSDDPVPFQRLMENDEPDEFRGYRTLRWRDRGIAGVSIEYRFPVFAMKNRRGTGLDAYALADFGNVFDELSNALSEEVTSSFGGGLRLISKRGFSGRLEVAHSEEETVFRIRAEQVFQYSKGGLYHGRDKSALR